jgi:hypothetical protein
MSPRCIVILALLTVLLVSACSPGDGANSQVLATPLTTTTSAPPSVPPTIAPTTPTPAEPCIKFSVGDGLPSVELQARTAQVIAIVTVREILPARWDTPDGLRPPDACREAGPPYHGIFRPVWVEVERYLRGEEPGTTLLLQWEGGEIGQDRLGPNQIDGYVMDGFRPGSRMVVFASPDPQRTTRIGTRIWSAPYRYAIAPDGTVMVRERDSFRRRTIPLQQIIDEVAPGARP